MKKFDKINKQEKSLSFLYMWHTHVHEKNRLIELLWTLATTLQTKLKQKFVSCVLSMWSTHASEKNKTLFGPSQWPCKLSQNKSVQWHKNSHMTQNTTLTNPLLLKITKLTYPTTTPSPFISFKRKKSWASGVHVTPLY